MNNENSNFFNKIKSLVKNNCQEASVFKGFVSLSISLSIGIYLISIATGHIEKDKRRLDPSELGLAAVLLLINSGLKELKLTKDSVDITLEDKVHSNFKTNQTEAHALTYLGEVLLTEDKNKEHQKRFFDILLNDGDLELLEKIYESENLMYDKSEISDHLLHLVSLGFIKPKPKYALKKFLINDMPYQGDLREYFDLAEEGKKCLELGSSPTIQSSATDYSPNLEVDGKKMSLSATQN